MRFNKKKTILLIIILFMFTLSPVFKIRSVEIIDLGKPNENFPSELLQTSSNIFLFDSDAYSKKIIDTGLVEEVQVEKKFFLNLLTKIKWREPFIAIKSGEKKVVLDKYSYVIYIDNLDKESKVGIIDGVTVKSARIGEPIIIDNDYILENTVYLYLLTLTNKSFSISPNFVIRNNKIMLKISEKYEIDFGDGSNAVERFSRALDMYEELSKKKLLVE